MNTSRFACAPSVLRRAWRSWRRHRCARSWGFPANTSDEVTAARLRRDAVCLFGVTDAHRLVLRPTDFPSQETS